MDTIGCTSAVLISYLLRFPTAEAVRHLNDDMHFLFLIVGLQIIGFSVFRSYSAMWRFTGLPALGSLVAVVTISLFSIIILAYVLQIPAPARSIIALDWFLANSICGGIRLLMREYHSHRPKSKRSRKADQRVLIFGAGQAGELLLRSIELSYDMNIFVVGFVDDDPINSDVIFAINVSLETVG